MTAPQLVPTRRTEIVFIEDNLPDLATLLASIGAGREVVVLDSTRDGMQQIGAALQGRSGIDAVHIVSHGAAGAVNLGTVTLDQHKLDDYQAELAALGAALAPDGDILLYGCDVGAGVGAAFLDKLALATGADVAASLDATGGVALGGDWELEASHGKVATASAIDPSAGAGYDGLLAITSTFNFGFDGEDGDVALSTGDGSGNTTDVTTSYEGITFRFDGEAESVDLLGPVIKMSPNAHERSVTISAGAGNVFTPVSFKIWATSSTLRLLVSAYDADGNMIGTPINRIIGGTITTVSFSSFINVSYLRLSPSDGVLNMQTFMIDDFKVSYAGPVDTTAPTVSISADKTALKAGETATITFQFSEDPNGTFTEADVTVTGGSIGAVSGTGTTRTATFTPTDGVNGGSATIAVTAGSYKDAANNAGAGASLATITYDTAAPATTVASLALSADTGSSSTDFITRTAAQVLSGTLSANLAAGEKVQVSLDNGASWHDATATAGSNAWSYAATLAGTGTLKVRVVDAAGNAGTAASQAYTLDTLAPAASTAPLLDTGSDSGASSADGITSDTTPAFSGTAGAGSLVTLYDTDGTTVLGTQTAGAGGGWTITASALAEGSHTVTAKVTDTAGNVSAASAAATVTIDTTPPSTAVASAALSADTGASASDFITTTAAQAISGTLGANLGAGEAVEVSLDNGASWNAATATAGTNTWTFAALLSGAGTLKVRVVDAAGNAGTAFSHAFALDTTAPTVAISRSASGSLRAGQAETITFTFSEDPGTSFDLADVTVTGGALDGLSATGTVRTATFTPTASTNGGTASISVGAGKYTDTAGNAGGAGTAVTLSFDTLAPAAPGAPDLSVGSDTGASSTDNLTSDTTPAITGTAEANAEVTLYDGGTVLGTATADGAGNWSMTPLLGAGAHTLTARARDAAGNASAASAGLSITVDTAAPAAPTAPDLGGAGDTGASDSDNITRNGALSFNGSAEANATVRLYDGATEIGSATAAGDGKWTINATLAAGSHTLTARAEDLAGNVGAASAALAVTVDTSAPAASSVPDLATDTGTSNTDNITANATPTFTGTAEAGATVTLFDGTAVLGTVLATGGTWTITPATAMAEGSHAITAKVTDAAGNVSAATAALTVLVDTRVAAPAAVMLDPASDSATAGDGLTNIATPVLRGTAEAGATITLYGSDGVTVVGTTVADSTGAWSLTSAPLANGAQALMATQTDIAGNTSGKSVEVALLVDTVAPAAPGALALVAASDSATIGDGVTNVATPVFSGTAEAFAQVTLFDSDGLTVLGTAQADAAGTWRVASSTLAEGTHAITATQRDLSGNLSPASAPFSVTIDTTAPAAPPAPALRPSSDSGVAGDGITDHAAPTFTGTALPNARVTLYDGVTIIGTAVADGAGTWSVAARVLAEGTHAITARQADPAGNLSAASAAFTLRIEAPAVPPAPLVDGVAVETGPVNLPGGGIGTVVHVPLVTPDRSDTSGHSDVADIPLAGTLLVAQVAAGFGLSAAGGPPAASSEAGALLAAAISAATPGHTQSDRAHLAGDSADFLHSLPAGQPLLVQTVTPVSGPTAPQGSLALHGPAATGEHLALVIDTSHLASGSAIELHNVDFAAVIGSVNVVARGATQVLTGDAASQRFTVTADHPTTVFAGAGDDVLAFGAPNGTAPFGAQERAQLAPGKDGVTLLHGGLGTDTAVFNGNRDSFAIEQHNGYVVVSSKAAPGQKVLVVNTEQLSFSDGTVAIGNGADLATIAGLYRSIHGRQADLYGFEFWADAYQRHHMGWGDMAIHMIRQGEWTGSHEGLNGNGAHDVGVLYQALFGRAGDAAGLAFWTDAMATSGLTLEQVATYMVQSDEMTLHHRPALDWDFIV